jgi:regulatory protein
MSATPARRRSPPSLRARAVAYLARREHSRAELGRKLAPHAQSSAELERLLDDLQDRALLSDARFADGLARRRGERFGTQRVRAELVSHGLDPALVRSTVAHLHATELQRAQAVWHKKFGRRAADAAQRLRQMRFLAARGFTADVIRTVVGATDEP